MAKVAFTANIQRHVACPPTEAPGRTVREVLDRDVERVTCEIEVGDDRLDRPVAIPVHDVAPIAVPQELGIEPRVVGPGQLVRTYADALGPGGVRPGGDGVRLVGRIGIRLGHGPRVRASKITM